VDDLSKRVFVDALTSVRNKGGFNECIQSLQEWFDNKKPLAFAAIILDCDNLKTINDQCGHERGDLHFKTTCRLICRVFKHSPVFRIGGDEFAVVFQNEDYKNRKELMELFEKNMDEIQSSAENEWERVSVSVCVTPTSSALGIVGLAEGKAPRSAYGAVRDSNPRPHDS
jgi:diguanylate cyclase (GGDEF)-like protein